ncbi:hypothetical protein V7S43_018503 [Phytophthora oleae]|uniref:Titin-like n=1 Tax=Phytophthora oleae TaxID=2107226 RepID=A0ABD3EQW7_9STRA
MSRRGRCRGRQADGVKLVIDDAEGQATVVEVHDLPAEVAETVSEDAQVVNAVTEDNQQVQIVVEGEPEHGEQTVHIIDEHGDVTVQQAKAIETSEGVKLEVETDEGPVAVLVAEVPEEIKQEVAEEQEVSNPEPWLDGAPNPYRYEEPAYLIPDEPALQTVDIVADNGEHEQVVLVGGVEDGKQTVEIANEDGGFTTEEVKAVETAEGVKLVIDDAEGQATVVEVHDLPAEVAETVSEDAQVVNAVTEDNQQVQIVVEGEPEHGEQTVHIIDEHGDVTVQQAKAIETSEGVKLEVETDEGPVAVLVAEVPEEIKQEVAEEQEVSNPEPWLDGAPNPYRYEEPAYLIPDEPALQTVDIVADNGEHEQVVLVGGVEDGKQTVEIANEDGGFTTEEVKAVETAEGVKLVIDDAEGQATVVEVHDLPAEVAETVSEDAQVVNAVTEDNQQVQIVVEGEPEHGEQTVHIIDEHGDVTVQQAKAIETSEGVKLEVETDEGPVAVLVAEVPEEIKQEVAEEQEVSNPEPWLDGAPNPYRYEEPAYLIPDEPALQTVDIVADNGEHEQVVLVGGVEDGKQTVEIANEDGGFTTEEVKAVETAEGVKLVIDDAEGQATVVEVHDLPAEVAETVSEDAQVVNAVTEDNQQVQIVVEGEPEHGEQTVHIIDEHGDVTVQQAKAIETSEGVKLEVETDEGPVAVLVAEVPEEIKQEVAEEQEVSNPEPWLDGAPNPYRYEEPAYLIPDEPALQTVDIVADNGEHEQVVLVGGVEDGKQTVEIANEDGGFTTEEVKAVETAEGVKLVIDDAEGQATVVEVHDLPAEVAETVSEDAQVVNAVTEDNQQVQIVVEGEPEHGEQTVHIIDEHGDVTVQQAKAIETSEGVKLEVETDEGPVAVLVAEVPEEIKQEVAEEQEVSNPEPWLDGAPNPYRYEEPAYLIPDEPALQTVDIVADNGEHEQVVLVGGVEDGKQTVEIANEDGGFTTEEVKAVETAEGVKLVIDDAEGQATVVEVHDLPAEVAETVSEDAQVVNAVTEDNQQVQIVVEGEPEHGEQTVHIIDEHGDVTVQQAKAIETSEGVKLEVETDEGPVAVLVAEVPEEIKQEVAEEQEVSNPEPWLDGAPNPYRYEEPAYLIPDEPALQTVDIVADNGEHEQVVLVGGVEDGKQTVEIANEDGGFTTEEVKAVETAEGVKLVIDDAEGQATVVEVHDLPAEVAETVSEDAQVVNAVTEDNQQVQIVVEGEPEHGEQTVHIIDEHGDVTVQQAKAIETSEGVKLEVETDEGPVAVLVAEVPEEIKQEVAEEQEVSNPEPWLDGAPNPYRYEEPAYLIPDEPALQTVDIVADNGEHEQVVLVGGVEDGKQTVEIANEDGGFTTEEVKAVETAEGVKLVIDDAEGQATVVEVHDLPAEVAETVSEDAQVVNAVTEDNQQVQIVVEGEPEHGEQTVHIIDEHGDVTVQQAKAIETSEGVKLEVETDEGPVAVLVAEVPEEIKQEVAEEQEVSNPEPWLDGAPNPYRYEEPAYLIPDEPALQTVDIVADNGEHEQVVLVGGVEDGKQTVEIANEDGGFTTEEVKAVETAEGVKLVIDDAEGQATVVEVHDLPAEVAETVSEDAQVVNAVTEDNQQVQIVVEGEPEHGEQTVHIIDEHGDVTVQQAKAIETSEGVKLEVETDEGPVAVLVAEVPEEIKQEVAEEQEVSNPEPWLDGAPNPYRYEEPAYLIPDEPALQTVDIVADNGEHEQVVLVGGVEDGKQTVEIANEDGGFTTEEVKAVETAEGVKLVIDDAEGQATVVEVHDLPAEVAETVSEDAQVVNAVTEDNQQVQIVVEGEPEHGEQTVHIIDEHGDVTVQQAKAIETSEGVKLEVETDEGPVAVLVAEVPEEIKQEVAEEQEVSNPEPWLDGAPNPYRYEEPAYLIPDEPALQTVDIVADNGEHEQVVLVGGVEDGKQTVEIANEDGGFTTEEVKAVETAEGVKLVIDDAEGQATVVEVHDLPAEVAETVSEDAQVVNAVTEDNQQVQIVVEGEPEHGEQTVHIIDEHGDVTVQQAKAIETSEGVKLEVETDEGPVAVLVAEVPEEIKQEVAEEQDQDSKYMTKLEFHDWIKKHYEDRLETLKVNEQKLEEEERSQAGRVKGLEDCIEQAANKFGYYGVYEQPPYYQNAVDWVEQECWTAQQWEPETPHERLNLRR